MYKITHDLSMYAKQSFWPYALGLNDTPAPFPRPLEVLAHFKKQYLFQHRLGVIELSSLEAGDELYL